MPLAPSKRGCKLSIQRIFVFDFFFSINRDLRSLSTLGHFLKGSSAAIGLIKLKASCEKIQNYGNKLDENGNDSISDDEALRKIEDVLAIAKRDFRDAEVWLKQFYGEDPGRDDVHL